LVEQHGHVDFVIELTREPSWGQPERPVNPRAGLVAHVARVRLQRSVG
jgi:hypothetical protein